MLSRLQSLRKEASVDGEVIGYIEEVELIDQIIDRLVEEESFKVGFRG